MAHGCGCMRPGCPECGTPVMSEFVSIEEVAIDQGRVVPLGDGRFQIVQDSEYIETLERAVLSSWYRSGDYSWRGRCAHCRTWDTIDDGDAHTDDCIVSALLEKYANA